MSPENYVRVNVTFHSSGQKTAIEVISKLNAIMFPLGNSCTNMPKKRTVLMAKECFENLHRKIDFISKLTPRSFNAEEKSFE